MNETHGRTDAQTHKGLRVSVVSPESILFEGEASSAVVPAYDGLLGILPRHAPLLALLGTGTLTARLDAGARRFRVGGGFVQVRDNTVRVVAEQARALDGPGATS